MAPKATLKTFDRRMAGRYVSEVLAERHPTTGNKAISSLSSYWTWLVERGHVVEKPWRDQRLSGRTMRRETEPEREFTDAELVALFSSPYPAGTDAQLQDWLYHAMRLAALSGMRIEEICRLTVADCQSGVFNVRRAKSEAGVRQVPIHSGLAAIVERRTAGKPGDVFAIHELEEGATGECSMPLSKQFTRYRRAVGVDDTDEGRRRSRVNFHSFRRWFVTKAERAGQPPHIILVTSGPA